MPQGKSLPSNHIAAIGFCSCGCGGLTTVYYGKARKYIHGHNNSALPYTPFVLMAGKCICGEDDCKIPYGMCHCGCGANVPIAKRNRRDGCYIAGKPIRYRIGHNNTSSTTFRITLPEGMCICRDPNCTVQFGVCHCGCGSKSPISVRSDTNKGWVHGLPRPFIHGHQYRLSPIDYIKEDRGHSTPCWIWKLSCNMHGYGQTTKRGVGKSSLAHVIFYERKYGVIPDGLELDHLCRVRACVNPDHLEPVARMVNVQRGAQAKLTPSDVLQIRDLYKCMKCTSIAELYNVSPTCISDVIYGKSWTNI